MPAATTILLVLTLLLTAAFSSFLFHVTSYEAHGDSAVGQAWEWVYTFILFLATWVCLGGLLWSAKSLLSPRLVMALIAWLVTGGTAWASVYILSPQVRWPVVMPVGVPVLLAAWVLVLSIGGTRTFAASQPVSNGVWAVVLLLTLSIWPPVLYKFSEPYRSAAAHRAALADPMKREAIRQAFLAKLRAMPPDQPVVEWRSLLLPENQVRAEAIEALRKVDGRQKEIEQLVRYDETFLAAVPELDLRPTPELCRALGEYFFHHRFVRQLESHRGERFHAEECDDALEAAVGWFQSRGCDCRDDLDKYAKDVREYFKDSPERRAFLERMEKLKQAR
jgi:hypothetical protein